MELTEKVHHSNKTTSKIVQLNQVEEMIDYYKYYSKETTKEVKVSDIHFLSKQIVFLTSLLKEINNYEFTTQKDAADTLKRIQEKIRKNVDFNIPIY